MDELLVPSAHSLGAMTTKLHFFRFQTPCVGLSLLIHDWLRAQRSTYYVGWLAVRLPKDILDRVLGTGYACHRLGELSLLALAQLSAEQHWQLWDYSAAFEDVCIVVVFDEPHSGPDRLSELLLDTSGSFYFLDASALEQANGVIFGAELREDGHAVNIFTRRETLPSLAQALEQAEHLSRVKGDLFTSGELTDLLLPHLLHKQ